MNIQTSIVEKALAHLHAGELKQAERCLNHPAVQHHADALFLKGVVLMERNRPREAGSLFEQALEKQPDEPEYLAYLGLSRFRSGYNGLALKTLSEARTLDERHINSRLFLAQCLLMINLTEEALGLFNEVLALDHWHLPARCGKIQALLRLGQLDLAARELEETGP